MTENKTTEQKRKLEAPTNMKGSYINLTFKNQDKNQGTNASGDLLGNEADKK